MANFEHLVDIVDAADNEKKMSFEADSSSLKSIAERLEVVSLKSLAVTFNFVFDKEAKAPRVNGHIKASVTQSCVISLDPVDAEIDERFSFLVMSQDKIDSIDEDEDHPLFDEDIEPLEEGRTDVGEIAIQYLSLSLDPYPRAEGVSLEAKAPKGMSIKTEEEAKAEASPFAVLKNLKDKS